jgi:hypothetical protein
VCQALLRHQKIFVSKGTPFVFEAGILCSGDAECGIIGQRGSWHAFRGTLFIVRHAHGLVATSILTIVMHTVNQGRGRSLEM